MEITKGNVYITKRYDLVYVTDSHKSYYTDNKQGIFFEAKLFSHNEEKDIIINDAGDLCEKVSGSDFYILLDEDYIIELDNQIVNVYKDFISYKESIPNPLADNKKAYNQLVENALAEVNADDAIQSINTAIDAIQAYEGMPANDTQTMNNAKQEAKDLIAKRDEAKLATTQQAVSSKLTAILELEKLEADKFKNGLQELLGSIDKSGSAEYQNFANKVVTKITEIKDSVNTGADFNTKATEINNYVTEQINSYKANIKSSVVAKLQSIKAVINNTDDDAIGADETIFPKNTNYKFSGTKITIGSKEIEVNSMNKIKQVKKSLGIVIGA